MPGPAGEGGTVTPLYRTPSVPPLHELVEGICQGLQGKGAE